MEWLETWAELGDNMSCPNCGDADAIETQDGVTYCYDCGWQAENEIDAKTAKIYMVTSYSFECPGCHETVDVNHPDAKEVTCPECGDTFSATYIG